MTALDTSYRPKAWSQKPEACPYGFVVPGAGVGTVPRPGAAPRPAGGVAGGVAAGGVPRPAGAAAGGLAVGAGAAAAGLLVDAASNRLITSAVMSSDGSM